MSQSASGVKEWEDPNYLGGCVASFELGKTETLLELNGSFSMRENIENTMFSK